MTKTHILNYFWHLGFVLKEKGPWFWKRLKKEKKTKINKKTVIDLLGFKRLVQKRIYTLGTLRLFIKGKWTAVYFMVSGWH